MDDPRHFERRNSDLHDFRKFSRTRSFTYGENQAPSANSPCPPLAFAAASAAVGRRQGPTIAEEDHEHDSSPSARPTGASPAIRTGSTRAPVQESSRWAIHRSSGRQSPAHLAESVLPG
jgi:M-phase inducer tyrosine phosphatase